MLLEGGPVVSAFAGGGGGHCCAGGAELWETSLFDWVSGSEIDDLA